LPEGHLRDYLAGRAGVNPKRDFPLLWALGEDLPGAIRITSAEGEPWPQETDKADKTDGHEKALQFSLAGVQLKFSAVMEATGGLTIPAKGVGGHWIVKLPSMKFESVPENEFAMMTLAAKVGIDVPEIDLHALDAIDGLPDGIGSLKGQAFAVKRFDRTENGPVHTEDFAQIFQVYPDDKYGKANYRNIASVIWIETGEEGLAEYVRRLVFSLLIGNADMHLKNWSLIYSDKHNAALAPAYDFVSTIVFLSDETMALNFGHSKRWTDTTLAEFKYFAAKAKLPEKIVLDAAKEIIERFHEVWAQEKDNLPLTERAKNVIEEQVTSLPVVGEVAGL
jgi:serine/threonine-protein kinase HipA